MDAANGPSRKKHLVVYLINFVFLFLIIWFESHSDSDKTIAISSLGFVMLVGVNLLLGVFAQIQENAIWRHYYYSALGLVVGMAAILFIFLLDI
jgi:hypothetical protein